MGKKLELYALCLDMLDLIRWCIRSIDGNLPADRWIAERMHCSKYAATRTRRLLEDINAIWIHQVRSDFVPRNGHIVDPPAYNRTVLLRGDAREKVHQYFQGKAGSSEDL